MRKETSICKRVPETQVKVIDFIAEKEDRPFTTVIKKVINSSPLFAEFRKQYELSDNAG
jgi:hypothetical protein